MLYRIDKDGNELWNQAYTNQTDPNCEGCQNAGEYVITAAEGDYAMYIDSMTWGDGYETGGNFALMRIASDDSDNSIVTSVL